MASLSKNWALQSIPPISDRISQLLSTVGDGSGITEMASATINEYIYKPASGTVAILERALITIEDATIFAANKYGGVTALTNGLSVTLKDGNDATIHNFSPNAIKKTYHWGLMAGSDVTPEAFAAGADRVVIRWTFTKGGYPLVINGDKGEYFSVNVTDDLSGLVSHLIQIQGYKAVN